jgi:DNA (cytosine-5)-methyltransferase 1
VFVAENVKGLLQEYNRDALDEILNSFNGLGYNVTCKLYLAADYGVPQMRERVFFVGTRPGVRKFVHPDPVLTPHDWVTTADAIADLAKAKEHAVPNHVWSRARPSHEQGNRKLKAHRPSDTIRAECHGNIQFHYNLDRRISMREAARLQSFPDDFVFEARLRETERQVGNAVPPVLAWHVARAVAECLR